MRLVYKEVSNYFAKYMHICSFKFTQIAPGHRNLLGSAVCEALNHLHVICELDADDDSDG